MYLYGLGVQVDYTQAYIWFGLAAQTGDKYAERFQQAAAAAMSVEQIRNAELLMQKQRKLLPVINQQN